MKRLVAFGSRIQQKLCGEGVRTHALARLSQTLTAEQYGLAAGRAVDGRRMPTFDRGAASEDLAISVRVMPFRANVSDDATLGRQCQTALPRRRHLRDHLR